MTTCCALDGMLLESCTENLRGNIDLVKTAIKNNGLALCFAQSQLRLKDYICREAVVQNHRAIKYVD